MDSAVRGVQAVCRAGRVAASSRTRQAHQLPGELPI
nr:MAG TPA_asm: hypothetical protein [Caudoviricetes sp.]